MRYPYIKWKEPKMKRQVIVVRHMQGCNPQIAFTAVQQVDEDLEDLNMTDINLEVLADGVIASQKSEYPEFKLHAQFYTYIIDQPQ